TAVAARLAGNRLARSRQAAGDYRQLAAGGGHRMDAPPAAAARPGAGAVAKGLATSGAKTGRLRALGNAADDQPAGPAAIPRTRRALPPRRRRLPDGALRRRPGQPEQTARRDRAIAMNFIRSTL